MISGLSFITWIIYAYYMLPVKVKGALKKLCLGMAMFV